MDRDRDDEPRRLLDQARRVQGQGRGGRDRGEDRADPLASKFDMSDWDAPTDTAPPPSPAARARSEADAAQAHSFFSHLDTNIQRILAGIGSFRDLIADVRASVADAAARDETRAEEEAARDKLIADRLIDPEKLAAYATLGAKVGVKEAIGETVADLKRRITADADARELLSRQAAADQADARAHDARRRRQDGWWYGALAGFALLVPIAEGWGYYLGSDSGQASGYARARDEVAAASWANTANGKLARQIDQASQQTIPDIATCPSENGWHSVKEHGRRFCYGTSRDAKMISSWVMP